MAKVLLVEDDNNLREIYEARLQAEGYDIASAQDGEQALVVAKQFKPDLIISDVMMPKISGFEMLDILRNTEGLEHTRVIMLTALGQAEDKSRADSLGADRYLVKSQVTLEDIVKSAHEILDGDNAAPVLAAASAEAPAATATAAPVDVAPAPEIAAAPVAQVAAEPVAEAPQPTPVDTAAPVAAAPALDSTAATPSTPQPSDAVAPEPAVPAPLETTVPNVVPEPTAAAPAPDAPA